MLLGGEGANRGFPGGRQWPRGRSKIGSHAARVLGGSKLCLRGQAVLHMRSCPFEAGCGPSETGCCPIDAVLSPLEASGTPFQASWGSLRRQG